MINACLKKYIYCIFNNDNFWQVICNSARRTEVLVKK